MEEQPQQQQQPPRIRPRVYGWIAGVVAVVAMVSGFAYASASGQASQPVAVVTEYRTAQPSSDGLGAAELASERQRLNRIKGYLNARKRKLDRLRDRLASGKAAPGGRAGGRATERETPGSTQPPR
jgi:hypothetical protein